MMAVVLASGGLDSSTALAGAVAVHGRQEVTAFSVYYGQRHSREISAAAQMADWLGCAHHVVDAARLLTGGALLDEAEVPDGRYDHASMAVTVVPGRNLLLASMAVAFAAGQAASEVVVAVHAGDHPIYADCRPAFWDPLAQAVHSAYNIHLRTPFLHGTKADIVRQGDALGMPWHLTWSCYKGGARHCGRCGTCVERYEAFMLAGVDDPTQYADPSYARTVL